MGLFFDILIFDCLLKAPQPVTGLFFAQIWTQGTLRHILVIFEICHFLAIPGPFKYFSENGWSQKIKVFSMKERSLPPNWFSFRRTGS